MKKKLLLIIIILCFSIIFVGCNKNNKQDCQKFKEEYESLNGEKNSNGKKYRNVSITSNNPFIYKTADDIVNMMSDNKTFVVYFGFSKCPWCRSVIEQLIEASNDLGLKEIYYVDVENIRDEKEIKNGKIKTVKKGSKAYYQLLKKMDNVLDEYTLYDNEEKITTGEKRIYAPNIISVVEGKAKELETGISNKQTDPYMNLTDEIKKEIYDKFKCSIKCILENKNSCSFNKSC